jgi:hypothetical protein
VTILHYAAEMGLVEIVQTMLTCATFTELNADDDVRYIVRDMSTKDLVNRNMITI